MNIKVGILGASNSLLANGWHSVITRSFECVKHAVGGSNSGIGLYKIDENNFINNIDIAVINFGVTEHEELKGDFISRQHLNILISELYKPFEYSKVHCISLLMPIKDVYDNRETDYSLSIHESACKKAGGIFIDGYKFIETILKKSALLATSDLFLDPHHLKPIVARFLGEVVKLAIYEINNHEKEFAGELKENFITFQAKTAKSFGFSENHFVNINNSNFNEIAVKLKLHEKIRITEGDYIHGLYVDCARSESKIKIKNTTKSIVKNLYCRAPIIADGKPQLKFCTLYEPLEINGLTSLEIVQNNIPKTESNRGERPLKDNLPTAYICGVLISKKVASVYECYNLANRESIQEKVNAFIDKYAAECAEAISLNLLDTSKIIKTLSDDQVIIDDVLADLLTLLKAKGHVDSVNNLKKIIDRYNFNKVTPTDIEIIKSSKIFDTNYYLKTYPDIEKAGVDPVKHYCEFGFKEGRNPSSHFNTKNYISSKNLKTNQNPLVHYIKTINHDGA